MSGQSLSSSPQSLTREQFLSNLICELTGLLEQLAGKEDSDGLISLVGQSLARWINDLYRKSYDVEKLDFDQVCHTLVDLKRRINGGFHIVSADREKIVLRSNTCPFGDKVIGHESLCMTTSNVFGVIASDNLGYSKVSLHETIARRAPECEIVVYLRDSPEANADTGREYCREHNT